MYWVTLIDWYASGLSLMIAAVCEITCIAWVYGKKAKVRFFNVHQQLQGS